MRHPISLLGAFCFSLLGIAISAWTLKANAQLIFIFDDDGAGNTRITATGGTATVSGGSGSSNRATQIGFSANRPDNRENRGFRTRDDGFSYATFAHLSNGNLIDTLSLTSSGITGGNPSLINRFEFRDNRFYPLRLSIEGAERGDTLSAVGAPDVNGLMPISYLEFTSLWGQSLESIPDGWVFVFNLPTTLFESAIPMNRAVGQVASGIHATGVRDFSSRLFRVRNRWEPTGDGIVQSSRFFPGREVAASRLRHLREGDLSAGTTINLTGVKSTESLTTSFEDLVINDESPLLAVTRPAGCVVDSGCVAHGEKWTLWAQGDFGNRQLDGLAGDPGLESNTHGTSIGLEYQLNDCLSLGIGWSHLWNKTDLERNLGGTDIEGDLGAVYATWFRKNLWADLMYSYGSYEAEIYRNTGLGTLYAAPDIDTHRGDINLGYNFGLCGGDIVHGPTFQTTYTDGRLDGYTERGNANAVTFADQEFESFITTIGWQANFAMETNYGMVRPQFRIGYGQEHLDQDQSVTATFGGLEINQNQFEYGESWLDFGAGVAMDINSNISLIVDYSSQFLRDDVEVHYGSLKASVVF